MFGLTHGPTHISIHMEIMRLLEVSYKTSLENLVQRKDLINQLPTKAFKSKGKLIA